VVAASSQAARLRWGAGTALVLSLVGWAIWGAAGAGAALTLGLVATALQMLAAWRTGSAGIDRLRVYTVGVVLRFAGVLVLGVMVTLEPRRFPPLPSAMGYLGTVLTLLYLETRLTR
jgi:hypothetical protein